MTKRLLLTLRARVGVAAAVVLILAAAIAGCGNTDARGSHGKTITVSIIPGWTDTIATAYLYKAILENKGYTVSIKEFSDLAPVYAGTARGDIDVMTAAQPERTQKAYWDKYKDNLEDLGTNLDNASLFLAVPDYVRGVQSISDLPSHASEFDGKIIGIEPGAGMTKITKDDVFPAYRLGDSFKLVTSSTTAMLAELKRAIATRKPIVVSLWTPFWANAAFPIRPLKDPKGAYGQPEGLHTLAREGFSNDFPAIADMAAHFKLTDEQEASLEHTIVNKYGKGEEEQAVKAWLDQNPDFAPAMEKYLKN